jgi:hypothetical protein
VRAVRPATMAVYPTSRTPGSETDGTHLVHPSLLLPPLDGRSMILVFVTLSLSSEAQAFFCACVGGDSEAR